MRKTKSLKIKVCGMRDQANIQAVSALMPDYMGFIFYDKSKRYVEKNFSVPHLPNSIIKVGVFVNESTDEIIQLARKNSIEYLQLHGDELPKQCEELKSLGFTVIKAFSISSNFDFTSLEPYKTVCDYFLFDTKGEGYGGTGKAFDWNVLLNYDQKIPFFLSGGISLSNAEEALTLTNMNLHAIDVNSGFEVEPTLKNIEELKSLFELRSTMNV